MHKEKDRVVAIGEVGLDYPGAKTPVLKENQELFLKEFLTAVRSNEDLKDLALVLHEKDMSFDKQDASARCLSILMEVGYPVSHKIYRHSFPRCWCNWPHCSHNKLKNNSFISIHIAIFAGVAFQ